MTRCACIALTIALLAGCNSPPALDSIPTSQPTLATDIDPVQATPEYWLAKTPDYSVSDPNFDRLWDAAEHVSEDYLFQIDRRDRRAGLLTTVPNVSAQWFEVWRRELQTARDKLISSISSHRRTIYWQFEHTGDTYTVTPRVIVERQALDEQRISGVLSKAYFRRDPLAQFPGSMERDEGIILPESYWYPVGRDFTLEKKLVEKVQQDLH